MRGPCSFFVAWMLFFSGCGPTTAKELCTDGTGALCRQLYRCRPDEARAVWPNIQDCTAALSETARCTRETSTTCRLDAYKSSACIDDIDNLRCDQEITWPASCEALECLP